jgi:TPR repeat protein
VIEKNFDESYFWHMKAAKAGHVVAAAAVGIMHQHGTGCKKDAEVALKWLKLAADKGCIEAQGHLAQHYYGLRLYNKCFQWASTVLFPL